MTGPVYHLPPEISLDPTDWDEFRAVAHRMVDDMITHLTTVRARPVWQPMPADAKRSLDEPLPTVPQSLSDVYEQFQRDILPYPIGNIHPRFWGWVLGTGTPVAVMAEMLAATMNPNAAGCDQASTEVEKQVISWLAGIMGFAGGSGLLVSGATVANLTALIVARHAKAGFDVREQGLQSGTPPLAVYSSTEAHSCVQKACEVLGIGRRGYRRVPVDAEYRIRLDRLREMVAEDRVRGWRPICVSGTAGTVNTGAVDDLTALADFCREQDLWFHVDGAFGAMARFAPGVAPLLDGIERADSVAFDLHKWGYIPYEAGCVLVRDAKVHREAFALSPSYLASTGRGVAVDATFFSDLGLQLSRSFRSLKVWMALKTQGAEAWGRAIEQNVEQARYLAGLVEHHAELELLAPVPLNLVCFRYTCAEWDEARHNTVNQEILLRLQEGGIAVPSATVLGGRFAIRVAIANHRSRREDFDALVDAVIRIGRELK